ncbi:MAG: hypothetical protein Q7L07_06475 [Pseudohongiella sp.]|nr:hypothetical protein [Pseudohongiella sp.]
MTTLRRLACLGICLCWATVAAAQLERVGDVALLDHHGEFHQLSRYQHKQAVALMAWLPGCAAQETTLKAFSDLQAQYAQQDVAFLLVDASGSKGRTASTMDGLPVLHDETQLVSESLGMEQAGDVRLINPQRLTLLYKGPAGQALANALDTLQGEPVRQTVTVAHNSCSIDFAARKAHQLNPPDYATDIAPLVIEKCVACHRENGVGPFQIDSHLSLLGWSPMIREVVMNRRMPPTQVDTMVGHSVDARRLSTEERQMLVHWIDAGGPRGDSAQDPLAEFEFTGDNNWLLGEPDYIVKTPPYAIPAAGILDYVYVDVALPFTEDRWVRAIQYLPGSPKSLHHLMAYVTAPDEDFWGTERSNTAASRRFLTSYIPGEPTVREYAPGTAIFVPAGHKLSLQLHYMTYGMQSVDETQIGLYFTEQPGLKEVRTRAVSVNNFLLPARSTNFAMQAEHVLEEAVVVTGVRARMNYRGKHMRFAAVLPDGSQRELFSIPSYNYAWQPHYQLDQPVHLPAGSRLRVSGAFDNSVSNPANPDPARDVSFGLSSSDEVFIGYFTYYAAE